MMNGLVLLLVVGASLAVGMASLGNNIALNTQELGVGEETIDFPISAGLTILIDRTTNPNVQTDYKDLIVSCKFTLQLLEDPIPIGSTIYCKLLDINGNVIAEGKITLDNSNGPLSPGDSIVIPITDVFGPPPINANNIENVYDIVFVVQGP